MAMNICRDDERNYGFIHQYKDSNLTVMWWTCCSNSQLSKLSDISVNGFGTTSYIRTFYTKLLLTSNRPRLLQSNQAKPFCVNVQKSGINSHGLFLTC